MKKNEFKQNNKGFTLVEIIIVIAVMAILTGFLAPQIMTYVEESRQAKDLSLLNSVFTAVQTTVALKDTADMDTDITTAANGNSKLKSLLGDTMDTVGEIQGLAKSKLGKDGTLKIKYIKANGHIEVYVVDNTGAITIGPVKNY